MIERGMDRYIVKEGVERILKLRELKEQLLKVEGDNVHL